MGKYETCGDGHHHHHHSGCCHGGGCHGKNSKEDKDCCQTGDMMSDEMVKLADRAWEELMVEKMKSLWQSQMGEKMDKIAEASVEASMTFHMNQMKGKMELSEAANKIKESFA